MKLGFYAPMKSPDHAVPSGDRAIARGLLSALRHGGADPVLASHFSSRDGRGDPREQARLVAAAAQEIPEIIARARHEGWRAWITYHNYYKAPDLIGPGVARTLGIPYLLVEATRARKRLDGPWADFAARAEAACDAAAVILHFTERDAVALLRDAPPGQAILRLDPFLDRDDLPAASDLSGPMLAVGMMRQRAKLDSYRIIAETLALLETPHWRLDILGDGPARPEVARLMAPYGDRVRLLGARDAEGVAEVMQQARLLFWPGVDEAFGMAYLEAQAFGLPVVAQHRPGVCDVLAPGDYPAPEEGPAALARMLDRLLSDPTKAAAAARAHIAARHLRPTASATLRRGLALAGAA